MAGKIRKSNLHQDVKTMVTDMISEQALDSANFDSVLSSKTTDDITEGSTNQYYTTTRFDSDFSTGGSFASDVTFNDNVKAVFGDSSDLQIYHNSSNNHSYIIENGSGSLITQAENLIVQNTSGANNIVARSGAEVELFYNGAQKLETSSSGVNVSGRLQVSGGGTNTFDNLVNITDETNDTRIAFTRSDTGASGWIGIPNWDTDALKIYGPTASSNELAANYTNQRWSLYGGGSAKLQTTPTGVFVTGELTADSATIPNLSGDVTFTGNLQGPSTWYIDPAPVDSDAGLLVIRGDLQVDGTTTTVNSTTVSINDKNIVLADSAANASEADGAGITVNGASATISYDAANDEWDFNKDINVTGDITVSGTVDGVDIATRDGVLTNTTTTANAALPKAGGTMTGRPVLNYQNPEIRFEDTDTSNNGEITLDNTSLRIESDPDNAVANSTIKFMVDGTTHALFDSNGNLGIGTTSPSALLHLYSSSNDTPLYIDTGNANGAHLRFLQAGSVKHFLGCGGGISLGDKDDLTMRAYDNILFASGNSSTERLRITPNGDVSIGSGHAGFSGWRVLNMRQLSTGALINFEDDDSTRAFTFASQGSGMRYQAHIAGGYHRWETNANPNPLYIKDSGNVGINRAINLDSTVTIEQLTDGTDGGIRIYGSNSNSIRGQMYYDGTQSFVIHGTSGPSGEFSTLRFATGTYNNPQIRMSINKDNGYVGIGTTNPQNLLHLESNSSGETRIRFKSDNLGGSHGLFWVDENAVNQSQFYYNHSSNKQFLELNGNGLQIYSKQTSSTIAEFGQSAGGYNNFSIPNGKVGIGESNPQQKLDIVDTNNPNIRIRRNYSLVNGNHIGYQDYYGNSVLYGYHGYWVENASTNASQFRLYTGSGGSVTQRLLITSTGRVNIGDQSTPTEGLEVYGTGGRDNIALKYSGTAGGHQSGYLWKDFRGQTNAGIYNNLQDDGVGTAAAMMEFYTSHSGTVTKQMQIDRYGHITMPNQSAFRAYQTTDPTTEGYLTSGNSVSWTEQYDRNNDFSGGTFTAPVNGIYLFTVAWDDNGGNSGIDMYKNASTPVVRWEPDDPTGYAWQSRSWSTHIYLNANEYVQLYGRHVGSSTNPFHMGGGYWGWFSGMLVA